jgi:prevent-host-death family protein
MASRKASAGGRRIEASAQTRFQSWKLEDAKAKFSEVVRRAQDQGPQYVTVRGKPTVAIIDVAELQRLLPSVLPAVPLVQFFESLYVEGLDLERDRDIGRDVAL